MGLVMFWIAFFFANRDCLLAQKLLHKIIITKWTTTWLLIFKIRSCSPIFCSRAPAVFQARKLTPRTWSYCSPWITKRLALADVWFDFFYRRERQLVLGRRWFNFVCSVFVFYRPLLSFLLLLQLPRADKFLSWAKSRLWLLLRYLIGVIWEDQIVLIWWSSSK